MTSFPKRVKLCTLADKAVEELRNKGFWAERIVSGVVRCGRGFVDLGSRGLPNVFLPDQNVFLYVTTHLTEAQSKWFARAVADHTKRVALASTVEEAVRIAEGWRI